MPPSSSGPGCQVLSLKTGVQIPLGVHIIAAMDAMETSHLTKRISSRTSAKINPFKSHKRQCIIFIKKKPGRSPQKQHGLSMKDDNIHRLVRIK